MFAPRPSATNFQVPAIPAFEATKPISYGEMEKVQSSSLENTKKPRLGHKQPHNGRVITREDLPESGTRSQLI